MENGTDPADKRSNLHFLETKKLSQKQNQAKNI